jgi:hypothetical protein
MVVWRSAQQRPQFTQYSRLTEIDVGGTDSFMVSLKGTRINTGESNTGRRLIEVNILFLAHEARELERADNIAFSG